MPGQNIKIDKWLYGCVYLIFLYVLFGLVLIGVPGLARGGIVFALLSAIWLIYGILFKHRYFPAILYLPLTFYLMVVLFGFQVDIYPIEPVGKQTTAWLGSIAIAAFVANGVSLRLVVSCFLLVIIANLLAHAVGYDGRTIHGLPELYGWDPTTRFTALAGQANLLVAIVFTFPFTLFLFRKHMGPMVLCACLVLCTVFMFLTGSKSTLPFTLIFLIWGCLFFLKTGWIKVLSILFGGVVFAICSYIILNYSIVDFLISSSVGETEFMRRIIEALDKQSGSISQRVELAKNFWPYFWGSPFTGYGPNQFRTVAGQGIMAHNNTAELLINYGLLGTLIFYSLYLTVLSKIVLYMDHNIFLIAPLTFLMVADLVFVTHIERPFILLLCLMLIVSGDISGRKSRSASRGHPKIKR